MNKLPSIMAKARIDLAGNISGEFSPEDWEKIFARAAELLRHSPKPEQEAWIDVIRDFHREKYWGFTPNYKKPKIKPHEQNLGTRFIWYSFRSFLVTKVVLLYAGARYTADDPNPIWTWLSF